MNQVAHRRLLRIVFGGCIMLLPTCRSGRIDTYTCENPCLECADPCTRCPHGECVPAPVLGWDGPILLWSGPEEEVPECPEQAPAPVYEGRAGLDATTSCPPCECAPAACVLPPEVVASDVATCPNNGNLEPFPAPEGWDGACVTPPLIPDAAAESLLLSPPEQVPCTPLASPPPPEPPTWATVALACRSADPLRSCDDSTLVCAPMSDGTADGFRQCMFKNGEHVECPRGYPERFVFYGGTEGEGGCAECTCTTRPGQGCRVSVTVYSDAQCATMLTEVTNNATDAQECSPNLPPGDLVSMSAAWLLNDPGSCEASGGGPIGEVMPVNPATFCCMVAP